YYIKHNAQPANTADFYISQAVGALQEDDDQDGLAHFLEHMSFNGSKHFPGKGMINYVESLGGAFGANINAYTYYDETVYNLRNIPLKRESVIDTCLLILNDWAHEVTMDDKEIDAERGVIHEEWRTRMSGGRRALIESNAILYKDSKYGKRSVIGSLDVIDNFKYQRIKDLYNDWHYPAVQAIIVVGDIDVDAVEKKVIDMFSKIPVNPNAKERVDNPIPDNDEPRIAIVKDPEATSTRVSIFIKHDRIPKQYRNSMPSLQMNIITNLMTAMVDARMTELTQKPNPPFSFGYSAYYSQFIPKNNLLFGAGTKDNGSLEAYKGLLTQMEMVKRYGFTVGEFERAKANMLSQYEKAYNERDKRKHEEICMEISQHYLNNEPMPGIEMEYNTVKNMLPMIQVDQFNQMIKGMFTDKNVLISITGPEKEGVSYPTEQQLLDELAAIKTAEIEAYKDDTVIEPLVAEAPKGAKVVKEEKNADYGTTKWTLGNGVKVVIKTTDFKQDEILMTATSKGGSSLVDTKDIISADWGTEIVGQSGLGKFDMINLKKQLTGKTVRVNPFIGSLTEGFSGSSSVKDFETMLQLTYLNFTAPRFDKESFDTYMSRIEPYIVNAAVDPNSNFRDTLNTIMSSRSARRPSMNAETFKKVDFETAKKIYLDRFADASDFTFVFVGNIDAATAKPLIESYLGALPNIGRKENWKDEKVSAPKENLTKAFDFKMETPKTTMRIAYLAPYKYNLEANAYLNALAHILDLRYTTSIREEAGGTYGVSVWAAKDDEPRQEFKLNIQFDTDPAKADALKAIVHKEIAKILAEGPSQEDLTKTKDYFVKEFGENKKENRFWLSTIRNFEVDGYDAASGTKYVDIVNNMTPASCKKVFNKLLKKSNTIEVIMNPKN
ncbi:MAG: insulinase family protein, partial [Bacteroidales bacterium]|nr:insulinase family protein [Bacteroidales bacterium]